MLLLHVEKAAVFVLTAPVKDALLNQPELAVVLGLSQDQIVILFSCLGICHVDFFNQTLCLDLVQVILVLSIDKLVFEGLDRLARPEGFSPSSLVITILLFQFDFEFT